MTKQDNRNQASFCRKRVKELAILIGDNTYPDLRSLDCMGMKDLRQLEMFLVSIRAALEQSFENERRAG